MLSSLPSYEVEIKSLLGDAAAAQKLKDALHQHFHELKLVEQSQQLNHYFVSGEIAKLAPKILPYIPKKLQAELTEIAKQATETSVRTRQQDQTVLFIVKASLNSETSANGTIRREFEAPTEKLSLAQLDKLILDGGYSYQAKWSRQREAYRQGDITICLDRNAGYGYLAEFETIVHSAKEVAAAKKKLLQHMSELGVTGLDQDRLARMFSFYNAHWPEYYGTNHIFTVE